jgi:hypothetical protein
MIRKSVKRFSGKIMLKQKLVGPPQRGRLQGIAPIPARL